MNHQLSNYCDVKTRGFHSSMGLDPHPASGSAGSPGRAADDAVRGSLFDPHLSGSSGRAPVIWCLEIHIPPSWGDMTGRFWEPLQWGKKKKQLTVSDVSLDLARVQLLPLMMWICLREECCTIRRSSDFPVAYNFDSMSQSSGGTDFCLPLQESPVGSGSPADWGWLRGPVWSSDSTRKMLPLRSSSFWIWLLTCMQPSKSPSGGRSTPGWSCTSEPRSSILVW